RSWRSAAPTASPARCSISTREFTSTDVWPPRRGGVRILAKTFGEHAAAHRAGPLNGYMSAVEPRAPLSLGGKVARLALIGVVLSGVGGGFAYLGGWLTPRDLTPARFTDAFQSVNGVHPGFRRNHAKGLGVSGFFESNGNAVRLSKAAVFRPGRVPV